MFIGEYLHSLDHKGRVSIPKKFRSDLEAGGVLTRGLESCLFLYAKNDWQKLLTKMEKLPLTKKESREFTRYLLAGAAEVKFDSLGRIMVPAYLREYAFLTDETSVIGVGQRVELWDKIRWEKYRKEVEKKSEEIAQSLEELGL
ncbi:MAG: cell division/cell wall cluster transcriptional repressor MraZ [Candidatus Woykebacteria bacterium RBG_13_40_7b]|uniref:Transcriptional regulator MraZ n=1 Tax=Candidatus Woykebacteria bacterium RBG_13_40_7b TaxID=1802594 RepID=A0A1G1WBL0_9BACT|nr:MAG: cell division/cell wall cluster transcriptional repressor MraZ [Candidatus Woykebacteria bacterium RBG_13_40_7b]